LDAVEVAVGEGGEVGLSGRYKVYKAVAVGKVGSAEGDLDCVEVLV
jgi:hypothetical protein